LLESLSPYFSDNHIWAFLASTPIIIIGIIGTIIPVLPGTVLIYAGFVVYGLITGFDSLGWPFYLGQIVLLGISYLVDFLASAYGVRFYGGSRAAVWGAFLGSLLIIVIGPVGLIVGPLLGAVAGELIAGKEIRRAGHAGFGTFVGLLGGTVVKLVIAWVMVGWFIWRIV